jgi:integrase
MGLHTEGASRVGGTREPQVTDRLPETCQGGGKVLSSVGQANGPAARERPGPGHRRMSPVSVQHPIDPYKRHKTRWPGVTYRLRADGSRQYHVLHRGRWIPVEGGEAEAKALQGRYRERKGRGERVIVAKNLSVAQVLDEWFEYAKTRRKKPLGPGTIPEYQRYIRLLKERYDGWKIGRIDATELVELTQHLEGNGLSESGVANVFKPLRGALKYAASKGYIPRDPYLEMDEDWKRGCNTTREHREWTMDDLHRLIAVGHQRDERPEARADYGVSIELLIWLGARLGEMLGAQYGDLEVVGPKQAVLKIERQWTKDGRETLPKAGSVRRVPLPWPLYQRIRTRKIAKGAGDTDFISAHRRAWRPPSHSNFRRRGWNPAVAEAGLNGGPKVTPHDARHACASWLDTLGLDSGDATAVLGHSGRSITERIYTHAFNAEEREKRIRIAMEAAMGGQA